MFAELAYHLNNVFLLESARRFAARHTSNDDAITVIIIVFILLVLLVISKSILHKDIRSIESANWEHIEAICRERNLSNNESHTLATLLRKLNLKHPLHAITSMDTFDKIAYRRLEEQLGSGEASYIRKKLFLSPVGSMYKSDSADEAPRHATPKQKLESLLEESLKSSDNDKGSKTQFGIDFSGSEVPDESDIEDLLDSVDIDGTRSIIPGEELKIKFEEIPSMHTCGVILNEESGLVVYLPKYKGHPICPIIGEKIEGYMVKDDNYFYFDSAVQEVFSGEIVSCRISHANLLQQIRRRKFARVDLNHHFQFYHLPAEELTKSGRLNQKTRRHLCEGILINISAGGCAIHMQQNVPPVQKGDILRFPIAVPGEKDPIKLTGTVLKCEKDQEDIHDNMIVNVQFIGLEENVKDELIGAIFKLKSSEKKTNN